MLKRENTSAVSVLFMACLTLSMVITAICETAGVDDRTIIAICLGLFATVGWLVVVPIIMHKVNLQWREGTNMIDKVVHMFISYNVTEAKLRYLAKKFDDSCREQIQLQGTDTAQIVLNDISGRVDSAKSAFWTAHALARQIGFGTYDKVSNYLTESVPSK